MKYACRAHKLAGGDTGALGNDRRIVGCKPEGERIEAENFDDVAGGWSGWCREGKEKRVAPVIN